MTDHSPPPSGADRAFGFATRAVHAAAVPDPVTGQAAWFDLRVSIRKANAPDDAQSQPQFAPLPMGTVADAPLRYGAALRRKGSR